jgi:benzoate membrane transport protein
MPHNKVNTILSPSSEVPSGYSLRDAFNIKSISGGLTAALFGCSGPALIIISAAKAGHLSDGQTVAWLFSVYVFGGLISIGMAFRYRQPICGAFSITGAVIMITALDGLDFRAAVGAFIMSGALVLLLGLSGVINKLMRWMPMPIVMAMIAGAMIRFAVSAVEAVVSFPLMAGLAALSYFISMRFFKAVPPVLAAGLVGFAVALALGLLNPTDVDIAFVMPDFTTPMFNLATFFAISVPLAALLIGADNAQATGVLMAEGYKPPVNAMTVVCGVGGILAGLLGGHSIIIAGPMTAICGSAQSGEDPHQRYGAALVNGVLFTLFGVFAGLAVPFLLALPRELIMVIAGLAMVGVLLSALQQAFRKETGYQIGAFVALVVAMSKFSLFDISAPFWALVIGVALSWLLGELRSEPDV